MGSWLRLSMWFPIFEYFCIVAKQWTWTLLKQICWKIFFRITPKGSQSWLRLYLTPEGDHTKTDHQRRAICSNNIMGNSPQVGWADWPQYRLPPSPRPPKQKCIIIVFDFSRDDFNTQVKLETMVMPLRDGAGVGMEGCNKKKKKEKKSHK